MLIIRLITTSASAAKALYSGSGFDYNLHLNQHKCRSHHHHSYHPCATSSSRQNNLKQEKSDRNPHSSPKPRLKIPNHAGMRVCTHVCMYVCMYVYTYIYMYACMHGCMYVCKLLSTHVLNVCMHVCVFQIWYVHRKMKRASMTCSLPLAARLRHIPSFMCLAQACKHT